MSASYFQNSSQPFQALSSTIKVWFPRLMMLCGRQGREWLTIIHRGVASGSSASQKCTMSMKMMKVVYSRILPDPIAKIV